VNTDPQLLDDPITATGICDFVTNQTRKRLVWDLPLRAFHWLLAVSIFAAWGTAQLGFAWMYWHMRLGYWIMGLLFFRVIWGFVGPIHARFTSFIRGPKTVMGYMRGFGRAGEVPRSAGHNPLGGLMVILMLSLLGIQACTGLFATDDITWSGPYAGLVSDSTASQLTGLHHLNFNFIWAAIALHLAAILYYAMVRKNNLVPAMLTGWKPAEDVPVGEAIDSSQLWKAAVVIAVSWGLVYWILSAAPPTARQTQAWASFVSASSIICLDSRHGSSCTTDRRPRLP
jgi:cytochrome b